MPKPTIDYKKCISCGTCIAVCPVAVYDRQSDKVVVKHPDKCINCKACEVQCPVAAIKVKD